MDSGPLLLRYDGAGAFQTIRQRDADMCDKSLVCGEKYIVEQHQGRSTASHAHYFASVNEAWANLPEDQAERWPSSEHLRKYALIKTGFCDQKDFTCSSMAEARRLAAAIGQIDTYAVVNVRRNVVQMFTAKSQSYRSMGKLDFQRSKEAVLQYLETLLGTASGELAKAAA